MNGSYQGVTYGGAGGGGNGAVFISGFAYNPTPGEANTGGGGGGASGKDFQAQPYTSAAGGSGIVVLRYLASFAPARLTTGFPLTYKTGFYRVYVFKSSGTITF
jgi:hypothetical protein